MLSNQIFQIFPRNVCLFVFVFFYSFSAHISSWIIWIHTQKERESSQIKISQSQHNKDNIVQLPVTPNYSDGHFGCRLFYITLRYNFLCFLSWRSRTSPVMKILLMTCWVLFNSSNNWKLISCSHPNKTWLQNSLCTLPSWI